VNDRFPDCPHAGVALGDALRACRHPRLEGLKVVGPDLCAGCYYRTIPQEFGNGRSDRTTPAPLFDCAFLEPGINLTAPVVGPAPAGPLDGRAALGAPQDTTIALGCRHPNHRQTTRQQCATCADYLFPWISPRMPAAAVQRHLKLGAGPWPEGWWRWPNVQEAFRRTIDEAIDRLPAYPGGFAGRGVVIVGGGRYFPSAYVTIRVLRQVGCRLPIELWHLADELDDRRRALVARYDVICTDADAHARGTGFFFHDSWWRGWQAKPYAICHSQFREVLYLDADCYPVRDPEFVFDWRGYRERGAVFWPDLESSAWMLPSDRLAWFGVDRLEGLPAESGQLLMHKELCWRELNLALALNAQAEFTYRALWGDKDTYPLAWRRLGRDYARMWPTATSVPQGLLQYDDAGRVLFQHRASDKFRLNGTQFDSNRQARDENEFNPDLAHEAFCFAVLAELAADAPC
jgi:hypothetical protein